MLITIKLNAMKRIHEEFRSLNISPLFNFGITVGLFDEDNLFEWKCTMFGPKKSFYEGGLFYLKVIFPMIIRIQDLKFYF